MRIMRNGVQQFRGRGGGCCSGRELEGYSRGRDDREVAEREEEGEEEEEERNEAVGRIGRRRS